MKKRKRVLVSFVSVLIVIVCIFIAIGKCIYNVKGRLNTQIQDTLVSIADQNAESMEREVSKIHEILTEIAEKMQQDGRQTMEAKVELLQPYDEIYGFKRMGIIDSAGMAYATDGYESRISDKNELELNLAGEWHVSGRMDDFIGEPEKVNVFSVPVYDKENAEVEYVLFATYSAEKFDEVLAKNVLNNEGFSFVMKTNGSIVAGRELLAQQNGATVTTVPEADRRAIIDGVIADMQAGKSSFRQINLGIDLFTYYMPIEIAGAEDTWYLFTVIPSSVLTNQFDMVWYDVQRMMGIILVGLFVVFLIYVLQTNRQNQMLEKLAYVDTLTGGANYAFFRERLEEKNPDGGYIVSADIGDFRIVNNICGEKTGDELLVRIWNVLGKTLGKEDLAARINTDRFILYFASMDENEIRNRLQRVTYAIHDLVETLNVPHVIPYFGICAYDGVHNLEKVYSRASQAKNRIKAGRKENCTFYDEKIFQQTVDNKRLEDGFEHAIGAEEFEVWYQPKYDAMNSQIVGAEALVRWRKDGELIPPYRFISLFEQNGMIAMLDEYVFRHVCRQQKKWLEQGKKVLPVSVNVSRASLFFGGIANRYEDILKSYNLPSEYVQLEITESASLENENIDGLLEKFHDTGFRILLDDFGNGYSSLATLNTMKFDILKLDKSLIDYIGDKNGEELLRHTVELAKYFGLYITAEGVETKEQLVFLQEVKCDDIQGYYFSKPLPEIEFELLLSA